MAFTPANPNGQATSANSAPVVIASDQSSLTINQNDLVASGAITTKNLNPNSGVATAGSTVAIAGPMVGISTVSIQTVGTWTGLLTPQVSLDGSDWVNMNSTSLINVTSGAYSATIPSAAQQIYQADIAGFAYFRITATPNAQTGTATVYLRATNATGLVGIDNPLPPGANAIGGVTVSSLPTLATLTSITNPVTAKPSLPVQVFAQKTSSTTAVQLTASSYAPTNGVLVQALSGNVASVYVGLTGVTTATGFELSPGQSLTLTPTNANLIYIVGSNTSDGVCWLVG